MLNCRFRQVYLRFLQSVHQTSAWAPRTSLSDNGLHCATAASSLSCLNYLIYKDCSCYEQFCKGRKRLRRNKHFKVRLFRLHRYSKMEYSNQIFRHLNWLEHSGLGCFMCKRFWENYVTNLVPNLGFSMLLWERLKVIYTESLTTKRTLRLQHHHHLDWGALFALCCLYTCQGREVRHLISAWSRQGEGLRKSFSAGILILRGFIPPPPPPPPMR